MGPVLPGGKTFFPKIGAALSKFLTKKVVSWTLTAATVVTGVKGFRQMSDMLSKGQDIMANKTAAGGKIPIIYGTRKVGAQIVYMDTAQNRSRDLFVVYAISVGECEEIIGRTIEIDGNSILDGNIYKGGGYVGSDKISSGSGSLNTASQVGDNQYSQAGTLGTDPTKRYSFVFNLHHGASSQTADPMLRASIPNDWTANHKLNGICYIAASFDYDKKGMYKGVPQITVQVRGKKVFDPRDNSTAWSSNPALCFLDYIQSDEYGKGLATSQINMTTISAAANKCDALVDQPYYNGNYQDVTWSGNSGDNFIVINDNNDWWQNKVDEVIDIRDANNNNVITGKSITGSTRYQFYDSTQENRLYIDDTLSSSYTNEAGSARAKVKRFHCNGMVDTNNSVMENAKDLLSNMRGIFTYIDGKYELQVEDTGTSSFNITSDHIIEDAGISVDYGNKDKRANKVVVEFYNANNNYELDTATVLHSASPHYYSDDGEILEIKAEFPLVTDPYIAYNLGKAILTRSRYQTSIQFLGTPELYKTNVGDIVNLEYLPLNYDGTNDLFRIEALELQADGLVSVSMIQYFDVYTWQVPSQESTTEILKIPTIGALKPPQANSIVFTDTDASPINRPTLTWTEPTDFPVKQFRVDVVDSSANNVFSKIVDTPSVDLAFLPKGSNYVANITCFNSVGIESNASAKTFTIADDPVKTTEVEMNGVTMSTVETYGAVTGKTGNFVNFTNKVNFSEIAEFEDGFIVDGGNARFENSATFVDGFTGQGLFNISQGSIQFSSYTPSTTTNNLYNVGGSLYWNGQALGTGTGDITAVVAGTNLNGGGTSGSVTLNLDSTITGNHTFSNNVIIGGDLAVQGTTTSIHTDDLNVKDKNITLNYSTGDSSASANGAGITIQDAVSATQDATLTWNNTNDSFNFSHPLNVTGNIGVTGTVDGRDIATDGTKLDGIEAGATTDQTQAEINALGITAIGLSGTPNITVGTINSGAIDVTGTVTSDGLTVDSTAGFSYLPVSTAGSVVGTIGTGSSVIFNTPSVNSSYGSGLAIDGSYASDLSSVNIKAFGAKYNSYGSELNLFTSNDTSLLKRLAIASNGDISFYDDTGSTQGLFWDASAENLLVGKTSAGATNTAGHELKANGIAVHTTDNTTTMYLNRKISDGSLIEFRKDNTAVGSIGTAGSDIYIAGLDSNHAALRLAASVKAVLPVTHTGALNDNTTNLGQSNARFKDLHLSGTANFGSLSDGTITITGFVDQDNMSSDSPTLLPTQQSVKAYVDANSFTINNNADNRIITGTATAGTLNAETTLTYGTTGADLAITGGSIGGVPPILRLEDVGSSGKLAELNHITGTTTLTSRNATSNGVIKFAGHNGTSETEYGRFDASGRFFVGTTSGGNSSAGFRAYAGGNGAFTIAGTTLSLNRLSSNGEILNLQKDTVNVGSIGVGGSNKMTIIGTNANLQLGASNAALLNLDTNKFYPQTDNSVDLGFSSSANRFRDLYLTGTANANALNIKSGSAIHGTITTSSSSLTLNARNTGIMLFQSGGSEKARIDASGNLLVGTTDSSVWNNGAGGNTGTVIESDGTIQLAKSNNITAYFNRLNSDGEILSFRKNGAGVGSIGTQSARLTIGTGDTGLRFVADANQITPWNLTTNGVSNGLLDLGNTNNKFKDLHLSGSISSGKLTVNSGADVSQFHSHHTTGHDDWQVSPISIRERGLNTNNSLNNQYSPNLNFHWASVVSRSLTMTSDGNFTLGEWTASGTPSLTGNLSFLNTTGYKVNNTTVIDSSRNLTNIGTISSGAITTTGNFTLSGADIVKSGSADLMIDVGGRINLSADDNGEVRLYDGSSLYGQFKDDDDRLSIQGLIQDKDMLFVVNDGGSMTTALKLDAVNGGDATFYGTISSGAITVTNPTANAPVATFTGNYTANGDVALSEWQRSGGAVKANFAYVDSTTDMEFGTTTSHGLGIKTGNTRRLTITSGGSIGINTTSPSSALHIGNAGHILLERGGELRSKDTSSAIKTIARVNGSNELQYGWSSAGAVTFMGGGSYTERMRIHTNGNIGIKNSNPTGTLTVGTLSSGQTGNVVINNEGGNTATLEVLSRTNRSILKVADNDTTGYISAENGLFSIGRNTGNNSANININSSNNVGIGTNSPSLKLHSKDTGNYQLDLDSGGTRWRMGAGWSGYYQNHFLLADTANGVRMIIDTNGNTTFTGSVRTGDGTAASPAIKVGDNDTGLFQPTDNVLGFSAWGTERMRLTSTGSLGIGTTSPDGNLEVVGTTVISGESDTVNAVLMGLSGTNRTTIQLDTADTTHTNRQWGLTNIAGDFYIGRHGLSVMTMKNDGNVGIGTTSPNALADLHVADTTDARIWLDATSGNTLELYAGSGVGLFNRSNNFLNFGTDNVERARITSAGNFGIGTTAPSEKLHVVGNAEISGNVEMATFLSTGNATVEGTFTSEGLFTTDNKAQIEGIKSSATDAIATIKNKNSTNTNGTYLDFVDHNDNFVCSIGTRPQDNTSNSFIIGGSGSYKTGLKFLNYTTYQAIYPATGDGATADDKIDLGASSARFDDIYATNGTIQTSDRNQKQDIQALTDAEQRVATACKGLIRRFRWQDSVAEKDDNSDSDETARLHFGVIAQDLQDAFEAENLDAGDYGMFISQTWEDDDGVEQTRLGVRYNELLAFIITTI